MTLIQRFQVTLTRTVSYEQTATITVDADSNVTAAAEALATARVDPLSLDWADNDLADLDASPVQLAGCEAVPSTTAAQLDRSWYATPGAGPGVFHVVKHGRPACNQSAFIASSTELPAVAVSLALRCARPGCRGRWPAHEAVAAPELGWDNAGAAR